MSDTRVIRGPGSGRPQFLRPDARPLWAGVLVALGAIAATTALIYPIKQVAPAVSTGVLYLLGVLLVSTFWGLRLGLLTALAGAAAFNWFHLPPVHHFTIASGEHWVALGVFLIAAIAAASVAELARARAREADLRRREADLAAAMARLLLGGESTRAALRPTARLLAEALGLRSVELELGAREAGPNRIAVPLGDLAEVLLPANAPPAAVERMRTRVAPALQAILAVGLERDALQAEVVETRALRRSDDIKTALLRAMSHDLRSPLTAIVAAADALGSPTVEASDRAALESAIGEEARRLARLVDQLLDLSRLEAGAAEPRRDWISLEEVARAAVEGLGDGPPVRVAMDSELPLIEADGAQLERAFANLVENARRHSGGAEVLVRARASAGRVLVRVVDPGPGIPRQELERIFEPFYRRAEDPAARGGAGLGLAIVKGFVEVNGGRVHAESLPGQGTSFVMEFPVPSGSADRPAGARVQT